MFTWRRRAIGVTVATAALALAACSSSLGIRGQTQSVSGVGIQQHTVRPASRPDYRAPAPTTYYNTQHNASPASSYASSPVARAPAAQRYPAPTYYQKDSSIVAPPNANRERRARRYPVKRGQLSPSPPIREGTGQSGIKAGPSPRMAVRGSAVEPPDRNAQSVGAAAAPRHAARNAGQRQATTAPIARQQDAKPPAANPDYEPTGWARWMGGSWRGHITVSGEAFDPGRLTAAHPSLPLPSYLYVTNRANGRTVLVRVNDRVPPSADRIVAISERAARVLAFVEKGRAQVDIQYAGPAGKAPTSVHEERFLRRQPWFPRSQAAAKTTKSGGADTLPRQDTGDRRRPLYPRWDNTRRN